MFRDNRGFTLFELVLAAGLAFVLLTLCVAVLVPLAKATARSADQVDLRQMAYVSLDRLSADLGRSAPEGISILSSPTQVVLAVQPLVDLTADGAQVWDTQLITWFWKENQLRRRLWPPGHPDLGWVPTPARPRHVTPAELPRLMEMENSQALAGFVESVQVQGGMPPLFVQPIKITLKLSRPGRGPGGKESYSLSTSIYLRNAAKKN